VVIEDGCIIESSLLCSGAVVKNHSSVHKGTVIGFNVIVKGHTDIPSATLVNLIFLKKIQNSLISFQLIIFTTPK